MPTFARPDRTQLRSTAPDTTAPYTTELDLTSPCSAALIMPTFTKPYRTTPDLTLLYSTALHPTRHYLSTPDYTLLIITTFTMPYRTFIYRTWPDPTRTCRALPCHSMPSCTLFFDLETLKIEPTHSNSATIANADQLPSIDNGTLHFSAADNSRIP